jgi:hypothetical protein
MIDRHKEKNKIIGHMLEPLFVIDKAISRKGSNNFKNYLRILRD